MKPTVLLVMLALTSPARADSTAVYAAPATHFSMTVKIASSGDIRAELPDRTYYFIAGQDYYAERTSTGVIVMKVDDMAKVIAEDIAKFSARLGTKSINVPALTLVRRGTVRIGKWAGDAYYVQGATWSPRPVVVISHDPSLIELGRAMKRQYAKSGAMMAMMTQGHEPILKMGQVLDSGAPISYAGAELQSVSFAPIPKAEFVLPAQAVSIDDVRKRMRKE
jgi:hypothetical protein